MIRALFLSAALAASAFAQAGEITKFECKSGTASGKVVSVSGCISPDTELTSCDSSEEAMITIKRTSDTRKGSMVETVQLAADWFYLTWEEELFKIELGTDFATMDLNFVGGELPSGRWDVNIGGIQHKFKVLGCQFN